MTQDNKPDSQQNSPQDKAADNTPKPSASAQKKEPIIQSPASTPSTVSSNAQAAAAPTKSSPQTNSTTAGASTPASPASPAGPAEHNALTNDPDEGEFEPTQIVVKDNAFAMWTVVLLMYLFILVGIGYISFWEQDFNDPENTIGTYLRVLDSKHESDGTISSYSDEVKAMIETDFKTVIQEEMKSSADAAGDLQELASQSFNIVLGAVLAFLSATATMIFQKLSDGPAGKNAPPANALDKNQKPSTGSGGTSNQSGKTAAKTAPQIK